MEQFYLWTIPHKLPPANANRTLIGMLKH